MAAIQIKLGSETFPTKGAAKKRIQDMLAGYQPGTVVNAFDFPLLLDLVKRHPQAAQKIGSGVVAFRVERNPEYPSSKCFVLIRSDGSDTDFSYTECLHPTPYTAKVTSAFRAAIEPDIVAFKRNFFDLADGPVLCPFTGEQIFFAGAHVDHAPPDTFANLLERFLALEWMSLDEVALKPSADHIYSDRLANDAIESRWIAFHNTHANLRVVSKTANLLIIGKG